MLLRILSLFHDARRELPKCTEAKYEVMKDVTVAAINALEEVYDTSVQIKSPHREP